MFFLIKFKHDLWLFEKYLYKLQTLKLQFVVDPKTFWHDALKWRRNTKLTKYLSLWLCLSPMSGKLLSTSYCKTVCDWFLVSDESWIILNLIFLLTKCQCFTTITSKTFLTVHLSLVIMYTVWSVSHIPLEIVLKVINEADLTCNKRNFSSEGDKRSLKKIWKKKVFQLTSRRAVRFNSSSLLLFCTTRFSLCCVLDTRWEVTQHWMSIECVCVCCPGMWEV